MTDQRALFEAAVVDRIKESGFLEIEVRTEFLVRCDDGYQDEIINAGWHYWNAALATTEPSKPVAEAVKVPDGWQLVPKEPTPNMTGAWYQYKNGHHWPEEPPPRDTSDYGAYRAMLAAAPSPTEDQR